MGCNSPWVLEGVLELKGKVGPRDELLHVPREVAVETRHVSAGGPAAGAVRPGTDAVCSHIAERVRVVDGEEDRGVVGLDAVDNEVVEIEGVDGKLLAVDVELFRGWEGEDGGNEAGDA